VIDGGLSIFDAPPTLPQTQTLRRDWQSSMDLRQIQMRFWTLSCPGQSSVSGRRSGIRGDKISLAPTICALVTHGRNWLEVMAKVCSVLRRGRLVVYPPRRISGSSHIEGACDDMPTRQNSHALYAVLAFEVSCFEMESDRSGQARDGPTGW